jgi:hypothetical protein
LAERITTKALTARTKNSSGWQYATTTVVVPHHWALRHRTQAAL